MNTIVCIKQVPAKDAPLAIAGNWINESDIGFEMNEPDSYALEEALQLKEKHGGKVVALSLGPERVKQTIHEALAKGADRGIHIADDHFAQLDPLGAAKMLVGEGDIHDCFGKECAGNNFPVFPKYVIKPSARSQTGRRAAWTPMHRKSNGR